MSEQRQTPAAPLGMYGTDAYLAPSKPDAILRYAAHARAVADLRVPTGQGPFPLAVLFHGGCWKTGIADRSYMAPLATRWQQEGIATLNVDYREVGDGGGWPGSFADWHAIGHLVQNLRNDQRFDMTRLTFVGHSAGALPAQWLASGQGPDGPIGKREPVTGADAIVFDGPADLARDQQPFDALCEFAAVTPFMGGTVDEVPERYAAISPVRHSSGLGEVLFVQARLPAPGAEGLAALRQAGVQVDVIENPGASHFDVITPGAPAYLELEPTILARLRRR
ncbi:hypothetical protein GCM10011515_12920 [Tsuneonella deserti]|uniref:BD-FAE-like domain-containing protein n=2 Tax=Tsuneonella deserti TaxID=2035528 RepID=A0ABQ1S980_9SPHN|nr:hypothetical protein GCM10011515_12920 [Tsuneonella deserti]